MKPTLAFIKELAFNAGEILQAFVGEDLDIQHKSRTDLVTKADHASENYLIDEIKKAFPDHAINAEESGELVGNSEHKWFIDPLDGTINYAHGVPIYCVSIGYAHHGQIIAGVVYDPNRKEFFCAERGQGATLNGDPIHVANQSVLIECMLGTGFAREMWDTPFDNSRNFLRFARESQTVRRMGSAALDIIYVAAGRLDGYWNLDIHRWDVAAGSLIVEEAGGVFSNIYGDPDFMQNPVRIVCANPIIHSQMLQVLAEVRTEE